MARVKLTLTRMVEPEAGVMKEGAWMERRWKDGEGGGGGNEGEGAERGNEKTREKQIGES